MKQQFVIFICRKLVNADINSNKSEKLAVKFDNTVK